MEISPDIWSSNTAIERLNSKIRRQEQEKDDEKVK